MAILRAGMAEITLGATGDTLQALGLGSCIGLLMIDRKLKVGGLVHIMLPDSSVSRDDVNMPGKFADTGIKSLLDKVLQLGADRSRLMVKMAGGAEMFTFAGKDSPQLQVGRRNIAAVREHLTKHGLRLNGEDVGGTRGRTLECALESLVCTVRIVGQTPVEI